MLGAPMPKVTIADAKGRWGSCRPGRAGAPGSIRYSWRLALAPVRGRRLRGRPRVRPPARAQPRPALLGARRRPWSATSARTAPGCAPRARGCTPSGAEPHPSALAGSRKVENGRRCCPDRYCWARRRLGRGLPPAAVPTSEPLEQVADRVGGRRGAAAVAAGDRLRPSGGAGPGSCSRARCRPARRRR